MTGGEGNGNPFQCSCLENPMDRGAWWATVHGLRKSRTRLSDFAFTFHFLALEKEMATHSSVLAWRIPRTGEPGGLLSMGSHRVRHDRSDLAAAAAAHDQKSWCRDSHLREGREKCWVQVWTYFLHHTEQEFNLFESASHKVVKIILNSLVYSEDCVKMITTRFKCC